MTHDVEYLPRGCAVYEFARLAVAMRLAGLQLRRALRDALLGWSVRP